MTHPDKSVGFLPYRECPTGHVAIATSPADLAQLERISPRRRENERNLPAGRQEFRNRKPLERFSGTTWAWRPWLFCVLLLLLAIPAAAQTTVVSGTITDANGTPYSNGTISATLSPPGVITPHIGAWQIQAGYGPFQLDSKGNFAMALPDNNQILPAGTKWQFTVNHPGVAPPLGTGPQTCSATVTITGASQVISSSFSCPAIASISSATALKPASSDAVQYVSSNGNDSNDGLSWGTAKATLAGAKTELGTSAGIIFVSPSVTSSAGVTLAANQAIIFWGPTSITLTGPIVLTSGDGIACVSPGVAASKGCLLVVNTAFQDGIDIADNSVGGSISNVGFDGSSRTNSLGAALNFQAVTVVNRWMVTNVFVTNWKGTAILLGANANDNQFTNLSLPSDGDTSKPALDVGASANNNMFSHIQIDGATFAGIRDQNNLATTGSANFYSDTKIDLGGSPAGTNNFVLSGNASGTTLTGFNFRMENSAAPTGTGLLISSGVNSAQISNGRIWETTAGTSTCISVTNSTGILVSNVSLQGCATGISDTSVATVNTYQSVNFSSVTAPTSFTNPQNISVASEVDSYIFGVKHAILAKRPADSNMFFNTQSAAAGTYFFCDANNANCLQYTPSTGTVTVPSTAGTLAEVLTGSVAGSTTLLAANTCGDAVTATVTGATTSMVATASPQAAISTGLVLSTPFVSAANTVTAGYCNVTTAGITPAAATFNIRVIQ